MSYLEHELIYRELVRSFLDKELLATSFVSKFLDQWRVDRDVQWSVVESGRPLSPEEVALAEVLDSIFTACDAYSPSPEGDYEINEEQLGAEVGSHANARWP